MTQRRRQGALRACCLVAASLLAAAALRPAASFPVYGDQTTLPPGTELNEDAVLQPREQFHSEAVGGRKSYLINLGDLAFSSPAILGGLARQAGVSCATCHVNGASNPKLFVPGLSKHPGDVRHDLGAVQSQGRQQFRRSGSGSEPARRRAISDRTETTGASRHCGISSTT